MSSMKGTSVLEWSAAWSAHAEPLLWPAWPALFILTLWICLWDIRKTLSVLPRLCSFLHGPSRRVREQPGEASTPLQRAVNASSHHQAWRLGQVAAELNSGSVSEQEAVAQAAGILQAGGQPAGQPVEPDLSLLLDKQSVLQIGQLYSSRPPSTGALSVVLNVLTIVNVLWVLGAIGMAVSFFPALFHVLRPLMPALLTAHYLLLPFYGLLCYSLCLYFIFVAARYGASTAPFVAFTGSALALATFIVLGMHNAPGPDAAPEAQYAFSVWFPNAVYAFGLLMFTPLATIYSSRLLGFAAATCLYAILHFLVIPCGLGWGIGWNNGHDMRLTSITSSCCIVALVALRVVRIAADRRGKGVSGRPSSDGPLDGGQRHVGGASTWSARAWRVALQVERAARPFRLGLSVFGCITLLLAGMLWSSAFWGDASETIDILGFLHLSSYATMNAVFVLEALAVLGAGALLSDASFVNTAATFLPLWLVEKVLEAPFLDTWVALFLGACAMVGAAFWLKTHPGWVAAMLSDLDPLPPHPAAAAAAEQQQPLAAHQQPLLHASERSEP